MSTKLRGGPLGRYLLYFVVSNGATAKCHATVNRSTRVAETGVQRRQERRSAKECKGGRCLGQFEFGTATGELQHCSVAHGTLPSQSSAIECVSWSDDSACAEFASTLSDVSWVRENTSELDAVIS